MFRILYTDLKIRYPDSSSSENSDYDVSTSYDVTEEARKDEEDGNVEAKPQKEDCGSTGLCIGSLKFFFYLAICVTFNIFV